MWKQQEKYGMDKSIVANGIYTIAVIAGLGTGTLLYSPSKASPAIDSLRIQSVLAEVQAETMPVEAVEAKSRVAILQVVAALASARQCHDQQTWLMDKLSQSAHVSPQDVQQWVKHAVESGCTSLQV